MQQAQRDAAAGLNTAGFVSGYRGSPLGMVDQQLWKAEEVPRQGRRQLPARDQRGPRRHRRASGTQRVERRLRSAPSMACSRCGTARGPAWTARATRSSTATPTAPSPQGGVLVVAGDDHGCVSSSMPHQSDLALQAWSCRWCIPGNVAEYLEFGLYGWALSRFSGAWVGFKAISEIVEIGHPRSTSTAVPHATWQDGPSPHHRHAADAACTTAGRRPAVAEDRSSACTHKIDAVLRLRQASTASTRTSSSSPRASLGIVTAGKAHLRPDGGAAPPGPRPPTPWRAAGVRIYKVGLVVPARADAHRRVRAGPDRKCW